MIGPPGTGKTTTIAEIVRACADSGERVIICSRNNRAVDNALGRLPQELLAIRVGNESRVTAEGLPYLLQRQAAELRSRTIRTARRNLATYAGLGQAQAWADELSHRNAVLAIARDRHEHSLSVLDSARRAAGGPATKELDRLAMVQAAREQGTRRGAARERRIRQLRDRAAARSAWAVIGWIFALLARHWTGTYDSAHAKAAALAAALRDATAQFQAAQQHLTEITADVPAVISAKQAADIAGAHADRVRVAALRAARSATENLMLLGVEPLSVMKNTGDTDLAAAEQWLTARLSLLATRRDLLTQWVEEASAASEQLHPELIRYAQVLAATCTGAGSRPELADLDFDLAIVDEAGQIGAADALVPLARAKRAALVVLRQAPGDATWATRASGRAIRIRGGRIEPRRIGSFIRMNGWYFLLWCEDERLRCGALLDLTGRYLKARTKVDPDAAAKRLARFGRQTGLGPMSPAEIANIARNTGQKALAAQLERLTGSSSR